MFESVLIANRGEIAIRVARAAAELGLRTRRGLLGGRRALRCTCAARTRAARCAAWARRPTSTSRSWSRRRARRGCDAVHPGYGFLSENAAFARRCAAGGLVFVGPSPEVLEPFGDKASRPRARRALRRAGAARARAGRRASRRRGSSWRAPGAVVMIKAIAGGGGRGMRVVARAEELEEAYARCRSEAKAAFGVADVYVEELLPRARHIEVQIVGDGRRGRPPLRARVHAPAPQPEDRRDRAEPRARSRRARRASRGRAGARPGRVLQRARHRRVPGRRRPGAPLRLHRGQRAPPGRAHRHRGGDRARPRAGAARARAGQSLAQLGLEQAQIPSPRGFAIQLRVNTEKMGADGSARPTGGTLTAFEPPSGPGVRIDTRGYAGYTTNPRFDSLLAKVIVHSPDASRTRWRARTARSASCASRAWPRTRPSCRRCSRHPTSRRGGCTPASSTSTRPSCSRQASIRSSSSRAS